MVFTIPKEDILTQLLVQLKSHFFITDEEKTIIESRFDTVLDMCEENFSHSENKYYFIELGGAKCVDLTPIILFSI